MKTTTALAAAAVLAAISASAAPAAGPTLRQRLLKAGELVGFDPDPATTYSAYAWAAKEGSGDVTSEQNQLQREGFVAGASEQLSTQHLSSETALSFVIQFRSAAGAEADLARELAKQKRGTPAGARIHGVRVAGIPNAHGVAANGELGIAGCGCGTVTSGNSYEVFFDDGPFFYGVVGYSPTRGGPPTSAQVTQAALRLFHRVRSAS